MFDPADEVSSALDAALKRATSLLRLTAACFRLSETEVDDLAQEVRIRLWKSRHDAAGISGVPSSYLHRTIRTAALDLKRGPAASFVPLNEDTLPIWNAPRGDFSPESAVRERELNECLSRTLESLRPERRLVLAAYLSGEDWGEIAARTGWSQPKIRNLHYRALAELRNELSR
jgi:RNA polymerase sigma factor (sigma-70 family)